MYTTLKTDYKYYLCATIGMIGILVSGHTPSVIAASPPINTIVQQSTSVYEGTHFRFTYPPTWRTGITAQPLHIPAMKDVVEIIDFSYHGASLVTILVIPRAAWNAQLPDEVPFGDRIAANKHYVYAVNLPQDSFYDPKSKEYPPYHKRVLTIDQIKLMFQGK